VTLWAELKKPQGPEVGAYAYLTNQLGHYVLGAALFQLVGVWYLLAVVAYFLAWELRHWNRWDSVTDTAFIIAGALPAYVMIPIALVVTWLMRRDKQNRQIIN